MPLSHRSSTRALAASAAFAACALALGTAPAAVAEEWPTRPVTIYTGFGPGSGVDIIARQLQPSIEKELGVPLIIDYRAGAGGNLASGYVARAAPDGYTLLLGTAATHGINAAVYRELPFDVEADFTPIAPLVDVSNVLTVNPKVIDVDSVEGFIEEVSANPGKYSFASTGHGTGTQLAFEEFNAKAGLDMLHVPYKGGPEALQSVLRGETCCIFNQVQSVLSQYQAGNVRLLGVSTAERIDVVDEVPTIAESGLERLEGFDSFIWFGLFGPKDMDPAIVERMNTVVTRALQEPELVRRMIATGNRVHTATPEAFRELVASDRQRWAEVVEAAGVQPQ